MASDPPPPPSSLPPPLPPSLPSDAQNTSPVSTAPAPLETGLLLAGRLHPLTLLFAAWRIFRGVLLPLLVIFVFGRNRNSEASYLFFGLLFLVIPLAIALVRYFTFRYRIENGELITTYGLLQRTERHIPLTRVQDIRFEQGLLHRSFGVAEVHVETAGGQGAEASLEVLSLAEANRLRSAVFARGTVPESSTAGTDTVPEREVVRRLSIRDLVLAGLTSNQMASALALIFVAWGFVDDIVPEQQYQRWLVRVTEAVANWTATAGRTEWIIAAIGAFFLIVVGIIFSVIGSVVLFFNFTLSRSGNDLHRAYGLLTRRASSLPIRRIQVLKIEETLLRRFFHLAALRADTAGSRATQEQGTSGRDLLLPIVPQAELPALLPVFFPDFDARAEPWQKVSPRAIRRGTLKGVMLCLAAMAVMMAVQQTMHGLWLLLLIPAIYGLNVLNYRHFGFSSGREYFCARRGWLGRMTQIVPVRNAQMIVVRQTPFDRRHGVATLMVDTAGQAYTGGGPRISNVPESQALLLARELAQHAAETRFRW